MVNFKPTEEQELVRDTMTGFAKEVLRPQSREADEQDAAPEDVVQRGWELGLVQSAIPEKFGGYGDARSARENSPDAQDEFIFGLGTRRGSGEGANGRSRCRQRS